MYQNEEIDSIKTLCLNIERYLRLWYLSNSTLYFM